MSPFLLLFLPQACVFSRPPLALQPNFYASEASSFFSIICRLLLALSLEGFSPCSLFRTRVLCFHQFAASFCKIPGVGCPDPAFGLSAGVDEDSRCRRRTYGTFRHANSFASYHIHVNPAASFNYGLFYATERRYPSYSQQLPHSFCRHGGGTPLWSPCSDLCALCVMKPDNACPLLTVTIAGRNCCLRGELASRSVLAWARWLRF